jgi:predicted N-acetyltransferase YhbS
MYVRLAEIHEMDFVYMMGYDVWSEGLSAQSYLDECRASDKYKMGRWYVLAEGESLHSSLVVYPSVFGIPLGYCGIGSVATEVHKRNMGYAHQLLDAVCTILKLEGAKGVYLHSDIDASFYERLGFRVLSVQKATCMVRSFCSSSPLPKEIPIYF